MKVYTNNKIYNIILIIYDFFLNNIWIISSYQVINNNCFYKINTVVLFLVI